MDEMFNYTENSTKIAKSKAFCFTILAGNKNSALVKKTCVQSSKDFEYVKFRMLNI